MISIPKKIFAAVVALLFGITANAQTKADYVILASGDTVSGKIDIPLISRKNTYTVNGGKPVNIIPTEVKEYYISSTGKPFQSVYVWYKKKPEFLMLVVKGSINLYQEISISAISGNSTSNMLWYAAKGTNRVEPLAKNPMDMFTKKANRVDIFGEMIKDKPEVYAKYDPDKKYDYPHLKSVAHYYNTGEWIEK